MANAIGVRRSAVGSHGTVAKWHRSKTRMPSPGPFGPGSSASPVCDEKVRLRPVGREATRTLAPHPYGVKAPSPRLTLSAKRSPLPERLRIRLEPRQQSAEIEVGGDDGNGALHRILLGGRLCSTKCAERKYRRHPGWTLCQSSCQIVLVATLGSGFRSSLDVSCSPHCSLTAHGLWATAHGSTACGLRVTPGDLDRNDMVRRAVPP